MNTNLFFILKNAPLLKFSILFLPERHQTKTHRKEYLQGVYRLEVKGVVIIVIIIMSLIVVVIISITYKRSDT